MTINEIFEEIKQERFEQDAKWGEQNHQPIEWCAILGEEVGEVNKEALEHHFKVEDSSLSRYREELIQVTAVAVAMIESLDRNHETSKD